MPRILHTETRADAIVDAVSHLIVTRGVDTLSLRSIAAATGLSPSTLLHQLTNRTRLLRVCASRFVRRHMAELGYRVQFESAHGFLPRTPEEIRDMRVWLGWRELGRSDDGIAYAMADFREQERLLLGMTIRRRPGSPSRQLEEHELDAAMAVVEGLREVMCARGEHALPPERATAALQLFVDRLLSDRDRSEARAAPEGRTFGP